MCTFLNRRKTRSTIGCTVMLPLLCVDLHRAQWKLLLFNHAINQIHSFHEKLRTKSWKDKMRKCMCACSKPLWLRWTPFRMLGEVHKIKRRRKRRREVSMPFKPMFPHNCWGWYTTSFTKNLCREEDEEENLKNFLLHKIRYQRDQPSRQPLPRYIPTSTIHPPGLRDPPRTTPIPHRCLRSYQPPQRPIYRRSRIQPTKKSTHQ